MKILVTGGAGFIGSHVVDRLLAEGHQAVVLDSLIHGKRNNLESQVPFILGDILDRELVNTTVRKGFDGIMHLAAQKSVIGSMTDPIHDAQINILGTLNLLNAAAENGVSFFTFAATGGAIYGDTEHRPTPEDHPSLPESPYGISKFTGEKYVLHYASRFGIHAGVLRMANVYGPRQDRAGEGGVVSIFCSRAKKGEPIEVFGDGEQTRDYVYVGDVADAFVRSLSLSKTITANIGTGQETSINELIKAIEGVTGAKIQRVERAPRMGEIRNSSLSIECARKHLDWQPTTSLQAGLKLTADQL